MAATPPPDWRRVPGADRAHLLGPAPEGDGEPPEASPGRLKTILTKPLVWALSLVLAAISAFVVNYVSGELQKATQKAITEPLLVYDVYQVTPPSRDDSGYVVPGDHNDLDAVEWGEYGNSEAGGVPTTAWTYEHGGTVAGWGAWVVVLEANREAQITIVDVRADDIECTEPVGGTHFILGTQGEVAPTELGITIDADTPQFKVLPQDWDLLPDPNPDETLRTFPAYGDDTFITLSQGEQQVVQFFAHATAQSCEWTVALEYATDGDYQTVRLDPTGEDAFALAAILDPREYDTVVIPYTYCDDYQGHAVPGDTAARILADVHGNGSTVDCT